MTAAGAGARRLATVTFVAVCAGYLLDAVVPVVVLAASGHGWSGDADWDLLLVVITFSFPLVGYLVARQQPRNAVAWVMLAIGMLVAVTANPYLTYGLVLQPGSLPGADVVAALTAATWAPILGLVGTFLILLFPDGHLPSPRWRWVAWFSGFAIAWVYLSITVSPGTLTDAGVPDLENPLGIAFVGDHTDVLLPTILVLPISILLCAAGLVQRYRRSTGVERLQLKWLATAGAFVAATYLVAMVGSLVANSRWENDPPWLTFVQNIAVFSFGLIPVAIGIAILKHGLYEIDVVINRSVVFATLAVFITGVYVAIVVGIGSLFGRGDQPNLALSIAATAVVAGAFEPVREQVQRFANRLVYGERAEPYEVLADFADRMGGGYDATELLPVMARTVGQGVGAASAEVWLATPHSSPARLTADGRYPASPARRSSARKLPPGERSPQSLSSGELVREASWPYVSEPATVAELSALAADRVVPVRHLDELLGALVVVLAPGESLPPAADQLLSDVAAQAGIVLRNVQLIEELRSSRQRLVTAQDEERRRLERRLRDGAQQRLTAVALTIRTARTRLGDEPGAGALDQVADQLQAATEELHELARGISPALLTDLGLRPAVAALAERASVPVEPDLRIDRRLPPTVEATLYFVAAEALTNVAKYAHADAVQVRLTDEGDKVTIEVADDGVGGADASRGSGLRGLTDRVAAVGGTLAVDSPAGNGTRLTCVVPVHEHHSGAERDRPSGPAEAREPVTDLREPQPSGVAR